MLDKILWVADNVDALVVTALWPSPFVYDRDPD